MRRLACVLGLCLALPAIAQEQPRIIDVHLHAQRAFAAPRALCLPLSTYGTVDPRCENPLWSVDSDTGLVAQTLEALERHNMTGVISGSDLGRVAEFVDGAKGRLIPAYMLNLGSSEVLTAAELGERIVDGSVQVIGEIENQYVGIEPNDPRMDPYWALAVKHDVPVMLHLGEGYPSAPYTGSPKYRVGLGNPLLLEEVLVRYPKLRLAVMHYGSPFIDEMIGILFHYPNVYIDLGGNLWPYPREYVWSQLRRFVDAGFANRMLFGSDQMRWPALIEVSIGVIEDAPFLSAEQKRDILYNNAVRFLRLEPE